MSLHTDHVNNDVCNFIDSKCIVSVFLCDCFTAVSASLEDSLASSAKATLQAIGAQEAALQAIMQHTDKLKEAMEAEVNSKEGMCQLLCFNTPSKWGLCSAGTPNVI